MRCCCRHLLCVVWGLLLLYLPIVTFSMMIFWHFIFSLGLWKRKDSPQQQLQPLRQVHPGQLPGEWHRQGVSQRHTKQHVHVWCGYNDTIHNYIYIMKILFCVFASLELYCVWSFVLWHFQSLCGEVSAGEITSGLSGTQWEVSKGWFTCCPVQGRMSVSTVAFCPTCC